jgi:hypothetical protein
MKKLLVSIVSSIVLLITFTQCETVKPYQRVISMTRKCEWASRVQELLRKISRQTAKVQAEVIVKKLAADVDAIKVV